MRAVNALFGLTLVTLLALPGMARAQRQVAPTTAERGAADSPSPQRQSRRSAPEPPRRPLRTIGRSLLAGSYAPVVLTAALAWQLGLFGAATHTLNIISGGTYLLCLIPVAGPLVPGVRLLLERPCGPGAWGCDLLGGWLVSTAVVQLAGIVLLSIDDALHPAREPSRVVTTRAGARARWSVSPFAAPGGSVGGALQVVHF